jgi:aminoglycoside phosphotransferase
MITAPEVPADSRLPALHRLLGAGHRELLREVAGVSGATIRSSRIAQVRYVPGRSVTVQYEVEIADGRGPAAATFVAMSGIEVPGPHVAMSVDGAEIAMWRYPHDPFLPGLAAASEPRAAGGLLAELGAPSGTFRVRRRAYRAGRRAVIQLTAAGTSVYLKVVRPGRAAALQSLHCAMSGALPVPRSLGWSRDLGIVALQAIHGRPLRSAIEAGTTILPNASTLLGLLDRIPPTGTPPGPSAVSRVAEHARLIGAVLPALRRRLERIDSAVADVPAERIVPVHGDFHSAQVLVDGEHVSGLVDIDTAGMGTRADDLAGFLAHLGVLSLRSPERRALERYGTSLLRGFERHVDPVGLRLRMAAAIVGFATGPFRVQLDDWPAATEERIGLAERWLDAASARDPDSGSFPIA